ncbi:carbohydrate kinase family protein [Armatimonas sp.]|uniref:carbohydrate kinase family protein n=1 Tax=Armatimonas sp. TaxID=1872638 RepID=UPI00286C8C10|nr:carbohydrate kinase family protein [Armatimonas sp.]
MIACLGILVADVVAKPVDALPARGTLELIERVELHIGGNAANSAASVAKLGLPVKLVGKVGDDNFGAFLTEALSKLGVDTHAVACDPHAPTATSLVLVHNDGERSFLHAPGANATLSADDVEWDALLGTRFFHVAGLQLMPSLEGEPIAKVLAEAQKRGMLTMLDTVMNPRSAGWSGLAPALSYLDWFVPSIDEIHQLCGKATVPEQIAACRAVNPALNMVIKVGSEGCWVAEPGKEPVLVSGIPNVTVVDTLGAGDSWCGGFLVGLSRGMSPREAAMLANKVGAACVQMLGATTGIPPLATLWRL